MFLKTLLQLLGKLLNHRLSNLWAYSSHLCLAERVLPSAILITHCVLNAFQPHSTTGLKVKAVKMPQAAGIISGIQKMVLYETRAVSPKLTKGCCCMPYHAHTLHGCDYGNGLILKFVYNPYFFFLNIYMQ